MLDDMLTRYAPLFVEVKPLVDAQGAAQFRQRSVPDWNQDNTLTFNDKDDAVAGFDAHR